MKDPLLNFIEEQREKLDSYTPPVASWNRIEDRLKENRKRKKMVATFLAVAALALLVILVTKNVGLDESDSVTEIETNSNPLQLNERIEKSANKRTEKIAWQGRQTVQYTKAKRPSGPYSTNISTDISYNAMAATNNGLTYTWAVGNVTTNHGFYDTTFSGAREYVYDNSKPLGFVRAWQKSGNYLNNRIVELPGVDYYYEQYDAFDENKPETPLETPLSTFGIDVDGAAYSNVRRFINAGYLPPKDAVKLEEMINYFDYDLPEPSGDDPFSITTEVGVCPWDEDNLLMQVALQGEHIEFKESKPNNLVFLIDVSGSMDQPDKLPLLKSSLKLMVNEMNDRDRIAIVVYAGSSGLVLPATSGKNKTIIYDAIENLSAGGSTAGGEGIILAYEVAQKGFIKGGNNRIMLATDGDFNVGVTNDDDLVKLIEEKRETGINLSVLGFGTGNLQNSKMEKLADNGNGNYFYIDNLLEAKKVLVDEIGGTMITIAKDVKLQVEFNPEEVKHYRLLGYENRVMKPQDFDNDFKDSGDLGSGHSVIAFYEIVPQDAQRMDEYISNLRYQTKTPNTTKGITNELAVIKFRYKEPASKTSRLLERIITDEVSYNTSNTFQFASAVAEFGLLIRESKYKGTASFHHILERAKSNKGEDRFGYRAEFIQLVEKAQILMQEYFETTNYRNR